MVCSQSVYKDWVGETSSIGHVHLQPAPPVCVCVYVGIIILRDHLVITVNVARFMRLHTKMQICFVQRSDFYERRRGGVRVKDKLPNCSVYEFRMLCGGAEVYMNATRISPICLYERAWLLRRYVDCIAPCRLTNAHIYCEFVSTLQDDVVALGHLSTGGRKSRTVHNALCFLGFGQVRCLCCRYWSCAD